MKLTGLLDGTQLGMTYYDEKLVFDDPNKLKVSGKNAPKKKSDLEEIRNEALIDVQLKS